MRPTFFVIGAAKAATTSLCELVAAHPRVSFCSLKEPNFFSYEYARGFDWYESLFSAGPDTGAIGEGSTTYTQTADWPEAPARMAAYAPQARLLYIVRDPLERMQAHWVQWRVEGRIAPGPFSDAIRQVPALLDASLYWKQLSAYRAHYPDTQIRVLDFEDFAADPGATVRKVFAFLEVPTDIPLPEPRRARNAGSKHRVPRRTGQLLRKIPSYQQIRHTLPFGLRRLFSPLLSMPFSEDPSWTPEARSWAIDRIADDAARFLEFHDKPRDHWPAISRDRPATRI